MRQFFPFRPFVLRAAAAATLLAATCVGAHATDPQWPASPDFPGGSLVPSLLPGSDYQGWTDAGGTWISEATPGRDELWQLIYERDGEVTVAIVTPQSYTADGSVETWLVKTSLLMGASASPMNFWACQFPDGRPQPVYARWQVDQVPTDVWTFLPDEERFDSIPADSIVCQEFGD